MPATDRFVDTTKAPRIASVAPVLPEHRYEQAELIEAFSRLWAKQHHNVDRLKRLHRAVQVRGRNLALPMERYLELDSFGARNDAFIEAGTELGARAISEALAAAGYEPQDVDALFFTTVTGLATPTIDALLVSRLGLGRHVKRYPFFGLGCVGGAAGTARMADYLRAYPRDVAVLLSVELCSLTVQTEDLSIPNLIATGLFGDGAVAVVGEGREAGPSRPGPTDARCGPAMQANRSFFHPGTERIMGWDIGSSGFSVVLSAELPDLVRQSLRADVDGFLGDHGLRVEDIARWVAHPGGPAVLEAMQDALSLERDALAVTWESLGEIGNLSSASVLFVLSDTLDGPPPAPGEFGLLMAMGPGFCSEMVLLRW